MSRLPRRHLSLLILGSALLSGPALAGGGVSWSVSVGGGYPPPAYYPAPVYSAPPPPVYYHGYSYGPRVVYGNSVQVYEPPPPVIFYGEGRRYHRPPPPPPRGYDRGYRDGYRDGHPRGDYYRHP